MASHSSVLAWRIRGTEEPGGLQSRGSQSETRLSNSKPRGTLRLPGGEQGTSRVPLSRERQASEESYRARPGTGVSLPAGGAG